MEAGTTFVLAEEGRIIDGHLWVVLSDTNQFPDQVVTVSFTTHTPDKDQACVVERNEHNWLTRRSCISYFHAKVITVAKFYEGKDKGNIVLQDPVTPELLARIQNCAGNSAQMRAWMADILIDQGIIRLDD